MIMKNIENKNFKDENELIKQFDDHLKWLKKEIDNNDVGDQIDDKNKIENNIEKNKIKNELSELVEEVELSIEQKNKNGIENIEGIEKQIYKSKNKWYTQKINTNKFKYKYSKDREIGVSESIDDAATSVDNYISSVPGFLWNRMRKIMNTEK